jgi:6-phosphogluconate dehydrogenase
MEKQLYGYGMIGLGTMGRNLVYNMCDHGYTVAGFDKDLSKLETLEKEKGSYKIFGARDIKEFINVLKKPRVILLLVPAGPIVDSVINELKPLISGKDLIMDCGNSHFTDTDRRIENLAKDNIHYMGVGISGGESGARYGPSIMPGGTREAYEQVAAMLRAVSAKVNNEPCVTYIGQGSAGHYVKMVHNGIEYALMQLIAESYQLLKEVVGLSNDELHDVFLTWNNGPLHSYLITITSEIFTQKDDLTQNYLIDMILDSAHQKGTGKWVSQNAMDLQVPIPAIDAAVSARDLSAFKKEREAASQKLKGPIAGLFNDKKEFIKWLEQALYFSMITTYAQGISLLGLASKVYKYELKLDEVAKIWRGGCIIRASLLESIRSAFQQDPDLPNLMMNSVMAEKLMTSQDGIRHVVKIAAENGIPIPGLMASLAYYDGYRKEWLPSNLLQAQRDFFGAHTYQRIDREGDFHTQWKQKL